MENKIFSKSYTKLKTLNKKITSTFCKTEKPIECIETEEEPVTLIFKNDNVVIIEDDNIEKIQLDGLIKNNSLNLLELTKNELTVKLEKALGVEENKYINLVYDDFFNTSEVYFFVNFFLKVKKAKAIRSLPLSVFIFQGLGLNSGVFFNGNNSATFVWEYVSIGTVLTEEPQKPVLREALDFSEELKNLEPTYICDVCKIITSEKGHVKTKHFSNKKAGEINQTELESHKIFEPENIKDKIELILFAIGDSKPKIITTGVFTDGIEENDLINKEILGSEITEKFFIKEGEISEESKTGVDFTKYDYDFFQIAFFSTKLLNQTKVYGELFITAEEFDMIGVRVIKEKTLHILK